MKHRKPQIWKETTKHWRKINQMARHITNPAKNIHDHLQFQNDVHGVQTFYLRTNRGYKCIQRANFRTEQWERDFASTPTIRGVKPRRKSRLHFLVEGVSVHGEYYKENNFPVFPQCLNNIYKEDDFGEGWSSTAESVDGLQSKLLAFHESLDRLACLALVQDASNVYLRNPNNSWLNAYVISGTQFRRSIW